MNWLKSLIPTLMLGSSVAALGKPLDRAFECKSETGTRISFSLSYGAWQDGVGYTHKTVSLADGSQLPLEIYRDSAFNVDSIHFGFGNQRVDLYGSDRRDTYSFRLQKKDGGVGANADGYCRDTLYKSSIWPYETSSWKLTKLECANGRELALPSVEVGFKIAVSKSPYVTRSGPTMPAAPIYLDQTLMPMLTAVFYTSGSNETCSFNDSSTVGIFDPRYALSGYAQEFFKTIPQPFILVASGGGGSVTGTNCPFAARIRGGLVSASSTSATFNHGFDGHLCASRVKAERMVLATYERQ